MLVIVIMVAIVNGNVNVKVNVVNDVLGDVGACPCQKCKTCVCPYYRPISVEY